MAASSGNMFSLPPPQTQWTDPSPVFYANLPTSPKVINEPLNNLVKSSFTTPSARSIYSAGNPSIAGSSEWSQNSGGSHGRYDLEPDPFDTSNIVTSPQLASSTGSRYYSVVPSTISPDGASCLNYQDTRVDMSNRVGTMEQASESYFPDQARNLTPTSLNYTANLKNDTNNNDDYNSKSKSCTNLLSNNTSFENSTQEMKSKPKVPLQFIKERDKAFEWLSDTLAPLSIGKTNSASTLPNSKLNSQRQIHNEFETNFVEKTNNLTGRYSVQLDSGDEVWNTLNIETKSDIRLPFKSNNANAEFRGAQFQLPPPPNVCRNILASQKVKNDEFQNAKMAPAYREPPAPYLKQFNIQQSGSVSISSETNISEKGYTGAIRLLSQNVPSATKEEILLSLQKNHGNLEKSERCLKVEELFKYISY